jgi:hypothetical protein
LETEVGIGDDLSMRPRAVLRSEGHSAILTMSWENQGLDTIEAVSVDGVLKACSVDNNEWRNIDENPIMTNHSNCIKICPPLQSTSVVSGMGGGGVGRMCVQMTLALGSVYDILITQNDSARVVRVRAPWVHTGGNCLVSVGTSIVCGGPDITWHGGLLSVGGPAQVGTVGQAMVPVNGSVSNTEMGLVDTHVAFETKLVRPSRDMADLVYLSLDRGMRITRIVTANTLSAEAMMKLSKASSRSEIMTICLVEHRSKCVLTEHDQLPMVENGGHSGWSFEQVQGSPVRAKSGVPGSVLWVADLQRTDNCHVSVGSWLLGALPLNTDDRLAALFTHSVSRMCEEPQAVVLVRPGFSWPVLVSGHSHIPEWSITFIEMQETDEFGIPTRRS